MRGFQLMARTLLALLSVVQLPLALGAFSAAGAVALQPHQHHGRCFAHAAPLLKPKNTLRCSAAVSQPQQQASALETAAPKKAGVGLLAASAFAMLMQAIPPAATGVSAALLLLDDFVLPLCLALPLMLEAAYYIGSMAISRFLTGSAKTLPQRRSSAQVELWKQCLDDPYVSVSDFITGWFGRDDVAPADGDSITISVHELQYDNVAEWLAYALFARPMRDLPADAERELRAAMALLEQRLGEEMAGAEGAQEEEEEQQQQQLELMELVEAPEARSLLRTKASSSSGDATTAVLEPPAAPPAVQRRRRSWLAELRSRRLAKAAAPPFRFPPGYNRQLRSWRLTLDPVSTSIRARPLMYYALTETLQAVLLPLLMRRRGFRRHRSGGTSYWYHPGDEDAAAAAKARPPPQELLERRGWRRKLLQQRRKRPPSPEAATPIVFVHGVGLGPLPYFGMIDEMLTGGGGAPMLVLELPFVSQRLTALRDAPHEKRTTDEIAEAMARHGISSATFVGHSLGTIYLAWLARLRPSLLASCVFIDPITFLLHHHKVAQSFIYSRPEKGNLVKKCEHYFIKSEHSIVNFFHRHFYWYANILWAHELPAPTAVLLSEHDNIVPVTEVEKYLSDSAAKGGTEGGALRRVHMMRGQRHGGFLTDDKVRETVVGTVREAQAWGRRDELGTALGRRLRLPRKPRPGGDFLGDFIVGDGSATTVLLSGVHSLSTAWSDVTESIRYRVRAVARQYAQK